MNPEIGAIYNDGRNTWTVEWMGEHTINGTACVMSVLTPRRGKRFMIMVWSPRRQTFWTPSEPGNKTSAAIAKLYELNDAERAKERSRE